MTRHIAVLEGADGETAQAMLAEAAESWRAAGARVAGLIAEAHALPGRDCAAGFLRDIATGERYPVYLEVQPRDTSCHLDGAGMAAAAAALRAQVAASDVVILSKFGKLEAAGEGLLPAFKAALEAGRPVLTTVSGRHREAWADFAPEMEILEPRAGALADWWAGLHQER